MLAKQEQIHANTTNKFNKIYRSKKLNANFKKKMRKAYLQ